MTEQDAKNTQGGGKAPSRRMSKDQHKMKEQRVKVFLAIAKILSRDRYSDITVDSIAAKLGTSKGTIYYYFKSKGEMLYRLQEYTFELMEADVYPVFEATDLPPRQRLERLLHSHVLSICSNWQICRAIWADIPLREAPVEFRRVIVRARNSYIRRTAELVEEMIKAEDLICTSPKVAARIMLDAVLSTSAWYQKKGSVKPEQLAEMVVRFCLYDGPFEKKSKQIEPEPADGRELVGSAAGQR